MHKAALRVEEKVLILKRAPEAKFRPNKWDLPGGNCEWPDQLKEPTLNPHQADVAREIFEETGVTVSSDQFDDNNLVYFASYFEPDKQLYSVNCGWQVLNLPESTLKQIKLSPEHTAFAWITLDELGQYDFGGPDRNYETKIIRRVLERG